MCGIVGSIGYKESKSYLISGLKSLDYRGYDSCGIALLNNDIEIYKCVGAVSNLEEKIKDVKSTYLGIAHTRWATHGRVKEKNSHPHLSMHKRLAIVHNGVIENFQTIKNDLLKEGYEFYSDTDSEVIANLIESLYLKNGDILKSINESIKLLKGSFACLLINKDQPDKIYFLKRSSPLLFGKCDGYFLLASDASPMIKHTNIFIELNDNEYGFVTNKEIMIYLDDNEVSPTYVEKNPELCERNIGGYPHFMLKEIEEIESVIRRIVLNYYSNGNFLFDEELKKDLREANHIVFLGCGTSYHASLIGARYFEAVGISCSCYIASEWAYYPLVPGTKPFVIMLSQSGETADLIHCLNIVKQHGVKSLIVTNTKGSTLQRGCDYSICLNAGLEVSVASTKVYVAEVAALSLIVNSLTNNKHIISDFDNCYQIISNIRENKKEDIKKIAEEIKKARNIFYLGRGFDYDLCLEASLKLKEISYIHSEAIAGGELKHGPIALIEEGLPVIVFISDETTAQMMRGNIQEVKSRGAEVIVISKKSLSEKTDRIIVDDFPKELSSIAISGIAFYLAYYVSLAKGYNVDKPRNLAKAVTVE